MDKIPCDVFLDLIPLVKDDVASKDSRRLVQNHIQRCEFCKKEFNKEISCSFEIDDGRVLRKIKNKLYLAVISVMILGALIGIGLTESPGLFYNIVIMPFVGGMAYFALNKKAYYLPIGLFIMSYFWILTKYIFDGLFAGNSILEFLLAPMFWSFIYSGLAVLGIIIAFLLKFAFGKEG